MDALPIVLNGTIMYCGPRSIMLLWTLTEVLKAIRLYSFRYNREFFCPVFLYGGILEVNSLSVIGETFQLTTKFSIRTWMVYDVLNKENLLCHFVAI